MDYYIRSLEFDEIGAFTSHLLTLERSDRRNRFNGVVTDQFLACYAERSLTQSKVIGAFLGELLIGASELHYDGSGNAEVAISIERPHQRNGLGYLLLSEVIDCARHSGCERLLLNTNPYNDAMNTLVRKLGGRLSFSSGDVHGVIEIEQNLKSAA